MTSERAADIPYSEMDVLDAMKLMEQGTDAPDDNEIMNRAIAEIERLRAALNNSQSLLVAMLLEKRPEAEIEAQVNENRAALGHADA